MLMCNITILVYEIYGKIILVHRFIFNNITSHQTVELVLVNAGERTNHPGGGTCHPLHLHGTNYRVVAYEGGIEDITVDKVRQMNEQGNLISVIFFHSFQVNSL